MTSFQSVVRQRQTSGLAGEVARDGPIVACDLILNSGVPNPIGFAYTKKSDGIVEVGGAGVFFGILGRPKEHALIGDGTSALNPINTLADGIVGTLFTTAILFVNLTSAGDSNVSGNFVFFADTGGALSSDTTITLASHTLIMGARVILEDAADGGGLAIVQFAD